MTQLDAFSHRIWGTLAWCCCFVGCATPTPIKTKSIDPNVPRVARVAVLDIGDPNGGGTCTLGVDVDAGMLTQFREDLNAERPDLVIVSVNAVSDDLRDCLEMARELEELEAQYQTVVWIRQCVRQATYVAWTLDELYMHSQANLGATSAPWCDSGWDRPSYSFTDAMDAISQVSAAGHRDPRILQSTAFQIPLSATRVGDTVLWFENDKEGELLINREHEVLCLDSRTASECGVSRGTVDDVASLCRLAGIETFEVVAKEASERFTRDAEERLNWVQLLEEERRRCQAITSSMAEMILIGTASNARLAEVKGDIEASLNRLSDLAKQHPRLAHKLSVEKLEGEPATQFQRWFLPEAREGLAELARRAEKSPS